jgi:fatty-acyl-CoA synthase
MTQLSYLHRGGETPLDGRTIAVFLEDIVRRYPDNEALVSCWQNKRLTYSELRTEVLRLARGLLQLGVEKGDRVGVWATDNLEWVELQLATAVIGAVLVNINPAYRIAELEHALTAAQVQTLFLMPAFKRSKYVEMLLQLCPELEVATPEDFASAAVPELRNVIVFDPIDTSATARPASGFMVWNDVLDLGARLPKGKLAERSAMLDCDDPINIQFTSGTTGFPKPVVLTHHNILNNGFHIAEALGTKDDDRLCVPVPFYHCFGMVVSNLGCLTHGAALVIPEAHFNAGAILAAIEAERCTLLHGVPTMFVAELEDENFGDFDLSSLRAGIMAGAPCPPELMRRVMDEMGILDIRIAYGQTECSPVSHCTLAGDSVERRTRTVGTNLPHQEVKIVDPATGATVPLGKQGEICFRGYHVMSGYHGMPEATAEAIDSARWLHSGDLGVMDEDGYVAITGRLKEMVIRGGENIYPAEIEHYLCRHPKVAQAAVFGITDEKWGEDLGAWVQLTAGETATEEELRRFVKDGMAHYKVPNHLRVVDEFPMTVTGKIQKFRIREIVEQELAVTA